LNELTSELAAIAECPIDEPASGIDLVHHCRKVAEMLEPRAKRQGVEFELALPDQLGVRSSKTLLDLLIRWLLLHAIAATPKGGVVRLSVSAGDLGAILAVEDGGPPVPEAARAA
jgi:signal transduction histidine kinase